MNLALHVQHTEIVLLIHKLELEIRKYPDEFNINLAWRRDGKWVEICPVIRGR
jgi:hypothetical protein